MTSQARRPPRWLLLFGWASACALLLFARSPGTGFVYDEQEAILANPYLKGGHAWLDAFRVDFWGLPVKETIGSYRPLPNLLWWPLAGTLRWQTPFFLQLLGPLLHAGAAVLLYAFLRRHLGALGSTTAEGAARLGAVLLLVLGVTTEAVTTVVGQADVLVAIWTILGLLALGLRSGLRELALLACGLLGLLSKETMLGSFLLWCVAQLVLPGLGGRRARSAALLGTVLASVGSMALLVLIRRHFFLGDVEPAEPMLALPDSGVAAFLRFFEQPRLPIDPQNNPLSMVAPELRLPTALRIHASNLLSMVVPLELVADYSWPREVPRGWTSGAWIGAVCMAAPLAWALARFARRWWFGWEERAGSSVPGTEGLATLGLAWIPLAYLPVSNLLVLLPTIRAERLLYVPAIGLCMLGSIVWTKVAHTWVGPRLVVAALLTSALQARAHALHYESDVLFWRATAHGHPASAKAHLNLGVMLGARGDPMGRVRATRKSVELAPSWPLGHVYLGDALCRAGQAREAISHYVRGLSLSPDQKDIAALALQCLWDTGTFEAARPELERVAARDPRGWLGYLLGEVTTHGVANRGVPSAYRSRGYNGR